MNSQSQSHASSPWHAQAAPGSLMANLGGGVAIILLIAATVLWAARRFRRAGGKFADQGDLRVVSSQTIGQKERLVVVDWQEERLLLGVTAAHISCLATADKPAEECAAPQAGGTDFQTALKKLLNKRGTRQIE